MRLPLFLVLHEEKDEFGVFPQRPIIVILFGTVGKAGWNSCFGAAFLMIIMALIISRVKKQLPKRETMTPRLHNGTQTMKLAFKLNGRLANYVA